MNQALILLDQIIEMAKFEEQESNSMKLLLHKANQTVGESALLRHLQFLKEILTQNTPQLRISGPLETKFHCRTCNKDWPMHFSTESSLCPTCKSNLSIQSIYTGYSQGDK